MKSMITKIITCTVLLTSFAAFAADDAVDPETAKKNESRFKRTDTNGDGTLTFEEFSATSGDKARSAMYFKRKDLDKNSLLTFEEYCEYHLKKK